MDAKKLVLEAERFAEKIGRYKRTIRSRWKKLGKDELVYKLAQSSVRIEVLMDVLERKHKFKIGGGK